MFTKCTEGINQARDVWRTRGAPEEHTVVSSGPLDVDEKPTVLLFGDVMRSECDDSGV